MQLTILLIDDDPDEYDILNDALDKIPVDCEVVFMPSAGPAMDWAEKNKPNFIFLDYNMPKETGLDIYQRNKNRPQLAGVQFVLYSTTINQKMHELARMAGISHYLVKTADFRIMEKELKKILLSKTPD